MSFKNLSEGIKKMFLTVFLLTTFAYLKKKHIREIFLELNKNL